MNYLQTLIFKIRAARINREIDALLRRPYTPSAHLVSQVPAQPSAEDVPDHSKSAWFPLMMVGTAFFAGYVVADDKRLDDLAVRERLACNASLLVRVSTNPRAE
ncbi:hypothetical protein BA896_021905 [Janthinobacterium lividum]|uniref:Uncharacterized protein n=1 Tax=Janthinobacterium lividum TaxID=29581 RepID=A0A1E8PJA7_9BURK|nr:hypothetical protein BA896_021905 [Janthinobacterium lividum]